jgi:ABC-type glutathione transport system ATPase component
MPDLRQNGDSGVRALPSPQTENLLEIRDLTVAYEAPGYGERLALDGICFGIGTGQILAVLGESGSGKSTLAMSILRILPPHARFVRGAVHFCGENLLQLPGNRLQQLRGARISMVFQHPGLALSPVMRIWRQVAAVIRAHRGWEGGRAQREAELVLARIFRNDPERIGAAYPHQLSGGERQLVSLAQALVCDPDLIIADEPTSALDTVTQARVLDIFRQLKESSALSMIFITHNPAILPGLADRVLVLRHGRIAEEGDLRAVFARPGQPYTADLLRSAIPGIAERYQWAR